MFTKGFAFIVVGVILTLISQYCQPFPALHIGMWIIGFCLWVFVSKMFFAISPIQGYIFGAIFGWSLLVNGPTACFMNFAYWGVCIIVMDVLYYLFRRLV